MKARRIPSKEQMLQCSSIAEVMRRYFIGHRKAKRLMREYGIDYGQPQTQERYLANEKLRQKLAMTIRRLKSGGESDRSVAERLGISRWQVSVARREFEIGHTWGAP